MKLRRRSDNRSTVQTVADFRCATREDVLRPGFEPRFAMDQAGKAANIRRSGKIRTWKRSPDRIEIPCKFGMYDSATFELGSHGAFATNSGWVLLVMESETWRDEPIES